MFLPDPAESPAHPDSWAALPPDEAVLIWSMRHLLVCWPTCGSVQAALHDRWGDDGVAILHLLRCWLTGLSMHARRPFKVGDPTCAVLLPDERALLAQLRAPSPSGLAALCLDPCAGRLLPLVTSLGQLTGIAEEGAWPGRVEARSVH